ncbi:hypothetical protein Tco_1176432 [Tanacetum coccineum]
MASLDRRLNPLYAIKECSSCGNLHTKDCGCSKGSLEDKILVPIPDLSQRPLKIEKICLDCGDPVHGLYCRQCALIRKTLEEVFQDFQDTSESSDDDTNFVNQEPFVVKQGPGVNSSQSPPQINHNCCYECGDSLDDIFCQRCTFIPVLLTEEPVDSLIMEDEHLDTIPAIELDEVIKSTAEANLEYYFKSFSSIPTMILLHSDDDSYEKQRLCRYASSPDVRSTIRGVGIVYPGSWRIDTDILFLNQRRYLREKLLNVESSYC